MATKFAIGEWAFDKADNIVKVRIEVHLLGLGHVRGLSTQKKLGDGVVRDVVHMLKR